MNLCIKNSDEFIFFDKSFYPIKKFDTSNNVYLCLETLTGNYFSENSLEFSFKDNEGNFLSTKNTFCNEKKCIQQKFYGDIIKIDGYTLTYSKDPADKIIFKIQNVIDKKTKMEFRCLTTIINSKIFILTYSTDKSKLILSKKIFENSLSSINFVTNNKESYNILLKLNINPYVDGDEIFIHLLK